MQRQRTFETEEPTGEEATTDVLVSVEGAMADRAVVRTAGEFAAASGGRLTVLNVMPSGAFADRQRARAQVPGLSRFTLGQAEAERRRAAAHVAADALGDLPIRYDCVGVVGREPACILAEARERGCYHVVLATRRRASLGAVRAEEVVEDVVESFEGVVTVVREAAEVERRREQVV